ncbi:Hypothetical protein PAU_01187 [Photorhabdus asymbiotica]|uniref:Uncharacterized protein n=1 Tax=Photorhabdus asymbiotica subsp. asymbiotica (strain ATCC 43949 / 3105-77) TaxID=553480 RepID=B6VKF6_PHOAA|nr:Hypothetical protein PAU_01187 [Photorhabdus asymbiotica]CAR66636.1 Hypothetical protein PA-RVA2-4298 [Photorhabdus asymbiotica subsp. asymbiotica ATCC 43949]
MNIDCLIVQPLVTAAPCYVDLLHGFIKAILLTFLPVI